MANKFDKVVKEIFEEVHPQMMKSFFGLQVIGTQPLVPKMQQTTVEKEADTVASILLDNDISMTAHIEWQTSNDRYMADRMLFYHGLLRLKYRKPVIGLVVYIGDRKLTMKGNIRDPDLKYGVRIMDIWQILPEVFLSSPDPAYWVFAILAGPDKDRTNLIREILRKLQSEYSHDANAINIRLHQLEILSLLRSEQIQIQILKEEIKMAFTIDITKDARYKEGIVQKSAEVVSEMLKAGKFSIAEIARLVNVDTKFVKKIAEEKQID